MKTERKNEKEKDFYDKEFDRILDYYKWKNLEETLLSSKIIRKNEQFLVCDKDWLRKWKDLRGYDQIKEKLKKYDEAKDNIIKNKIKEEVKEFFIKHQKEKNIDEIGQMDNKKLLKKDKKGEITPYFEEEGNFEAINSSFASYLEKSMDRKITVNGEFGIGSLLINNPLFEKNSDKKIVAFYGNKDKEIQKGIFTFGKDKDINKTMNIINKIDFKDMIEKKEKGENIDDIIKGMKFEIINEDLKAGNINKEVKTVEEKKDSMKKNEKENKNKEEEAIKINEKEKERLEKEAEKLNL